jgi:endonuclease/exonuclease/phosphatase family metal-dependent hydrolase
LLSFNIQVGISTETLPALPDPWLAAPAAPPGACRQPAKDRQPVGDFDLVALQEADGGSLRSGYINQVEHLAQLAPSPTGTNNSIATSGAWQHSNGVLSRLKPSAIEDHPCRPKGRGQSSCVLAKALKPWWW